MQICMFSSTFLKYLHSYLHLLILSNTFPFVFIFILCLHWKKLENTSRETDTSAATGTKSEDQEADSDSDSASVYGSRDNLRTIEEAHEYPESCFAKLFSDEEDGASGDEEEEGGSDFTLGLKSFVDRCRDGGHREPILEDLIAVATIQKTSTFQLPGWFLSVHGL